MHIRFHLTSSGVQFQIVQMRTSKMLELTLALSPRDDLNSGSSRHPDNFHHNFQHVVNTLVLQNQHGGSIENVLLKFTLCCSGCKLRSYEIWTQRSVLGHLSRRIRLYFAAKSYFILAHLGSISVAHKFHLLRLRLLLS